MPDETLYLHDVALEEAIARWYALLEQANALGTLPSETLPVAECAGRVTAAPVWARISSPHYHAAAMDGYAVAAEATLGATETSPRRLALGSEAHYVDTGDPLPPGANAVIMIEDAHWVPASPEEAAAPPARRERRGWIEILASVAPWQHVRPMGEDIVATQLVLPSNHRLRPQDLGAAAGCGHTHLAVRRQPRLAIIPTGTELVSVGSPAWDRGLQPGDIVEYNSIVLGAMAEEWGCLVNRLAPVPDDFAQIRAAVQAALADHDLVVINAGSSAGSEDFTARVIADLGQVAVHGVAIRPGHPVVLGVAYAEDGHGKGRVAKPAVGIPGYPVSAALTFELFVKPLVYRWQGVQPPERPKVTAVMTRKVQSPLGEEEFLRVTVGRVGNRTVATPLARGAGVLMSLVQADGIVRIPRFSEGLHVGAEVTVELLRPPESIANTIVAIGSHDLTLDLLADQLRRARPDLTLSSANVGSLGGLLALQRDEAHLAGSHLLDEATGEYNVKYIRELLPDRRIVLLRFVGRTQGLIVPPGNPKGIASLQDLTRPDVSFVNRQRGAGTRVLLDYHLDRLGIRRRQIRGYERQEFTHLAVAAAVQSGAADCGLGILAAARALGLDFVPLFDERYDLVIPQEHYESELLAPLLAVIRSPEFAATVQALGGYDTAGIGEVIAVLG
ncbi:MAG: molybdopterin biosynthesis protein [Caldilineales bacterium]|nr:molybdopterin biosynthesis protein [Caldilineales bacterium]MDW8317325.1 molybdopterin biosynthesis protein [Anaerolineae bacterium]